MVQRTVLKVDISCQKCKKKVLKAVSAVQGVDKIEVDEAKGTLTVTGNADPYEIIIRTRKAGKFAEVVSVGPPPKQQQQQQQKDGQKKADDKKPDEKKPDQKPQDQFPPHIHAPHSCPGCQNMALVQVGRWDENMALVQVGRWDEPNPSCSIQ